jgi:hypothetical protein
MGAEVFGQHRSVGVRVIATDDHQSVETKAIAHRATRLQLRRRFDLVAARSDDIKAALVYHQQQAASHGTSEYVKASGRAPIQGKLTIRDQ